MGAEVIRVAAAQYTIDPFQNWEALEARVSQWVKDAADAGAKLLAFPEYASMELASLAEQRQLDRRSKERHLLGPLPVNLGDRRKALSLLWATDVLQPHIARYLAMFVALSSKFNVYILIGTIPVRHLDNSLTNRAFFVAPNRGIGWQDKLVLTRWEREVWGMKAGTEVRVFDTDFGPIGIDICYDVEFPIVARRQAEAGARIILAPCCCDSLRGYYRVRVGSRARALENQAYVLQSPAIGRADWLAEFGRVVGFAGIYGPPDLGPHESGILAIGKNDHPGWVYADLDLTAIDRIRGNSIIANFEEWTRHLQIGPAVQGHFGVNDFLSGTAA